jgi:hypothetical protein
MMYGVSMNTDGTSKVICQRLEHAAQAAAEAAKAAAAAAGSAVASADEDDPATAPVEVPEAETVH